MSGNLLVRFDEGRVGRTAGVALSPTLLSIRGLFFHSSRAAQAPKPLSTPGVVQNKHNQPIINMI